MPPLKDITAPTYLAEAEAAVKSPSYLQGTGRVDRVPVSAAEWLDSRYLSNRSGDTFWREETRAAWESIVDDPTVEEVILDGSIGWGKTHFARLLVMRWAYEISCLASPGETFLGDPTAVLKFAAMSVKGKKSRETFFDRLRKMVDLTPYFGEEAPYNDSWDTARILTAMHFATCGFKIEPVVTNIGAVISDDLFVFVLDEANFLPRVKGSRRATDSEVASRTDGIWSAAAEYIGKAKKRIRSRFLTGGRCYGKVLILSSSIDDNDITEERRASALAAGTLGGKVRYLSKSIWEGKPPGTYSSETFVLDLGNRGRPPKVLKPDVDPIGKTIDVPVDLLTDFEDKPVLATRELAGRRSAPMNLWLQGVENLDDIWDRARRDPMEFLQTSGELRCDREAMSYRPGNVGWVPQHHQDLPRVVHIDLSQTTDRTGISMGCSPGEVSVDTRDPATGEVVSVQVPKVHADFTLAVQAPGGGRIDMIEIESFVLGMVVLGFDIRLVTFDTYQSSRVMETFESHGITTKVLSVDKYAEPYVTLRRAIRVGALSVPHSEVLERELSVLVEEARSGKVDHPPDGSKDVADSLAGVTHALNHPDYLKWAIERGGGHSAIAPLPM